MSRRIIKHLLDKKDHTDDLDGITLFVYENEVKELSDKVITTIGDLLSKGLLIESVHPSGKNYYQLSDPRLIKQNSLL